MEEKEIVTSKKFTLDWRDAAKGFVMAIITAVLMAVETSLEAGEIEINYKKIGVAGSLAAVAYLLKNFFTPAEIKKPAETK
jgi:hypothetical protein